MSIGRLFTVCMASAAVIVLLVAGRALVRDALVYRAHARAIDAALTLEASLSEMEKLAVERGPTFRLLTNTDSNRQMMDSERAATLETAADLRRRIAQLQDFRDTPAIGRVGVLEEAQNAIETTWRASRKAVDDGLALPPASRDPGLVEAFARSELGRQQDFVRLLNGLQARVAAGAADAASVIQIARYAADLREIAGLQASLATPAMAAGRPFTPQELQTIQRMQGEIDRLSAQIDAAIEYVGNPPKLVDAWRLARAGYFARGRSVIDKILNSGAVDGRFAVSMEDFNHIVIAELTSLIALRNSAASDAIEQATRSRDSAQDDSVTSGAVLVAVSTAMAMLTVWFRRRVVVPLIGLAGKINQLADGQRDVDIDLADRDDEIGGLARAMRVFRDALIENEHLYNQLLQSQKMEAIGTMAGGVAHELNNLLHPILMLSEILVERIPDNDEESRGDLAVIVDCATSARDIVRNIVTFARKTSDKISALDVAQELRVAEGLVRSLLPATISIDERIPREPCLALINRTELMQVVTNLVVNASHAMNQRGTVHIALEPRQIAESEAAALRISPGPYYALSVSDTGCGIDATLRDRIFEPFFTTKPVGQGTGLGLSVAYGIVRAWKGAMRVDSEVGRGSTFSVLLPMLTA